MTPQEEDHARRVEVTRAIIDWIEAIEQALEAGGTE